MRPSYWLCTMDEFGFMAARPVRAIALDDTVVFASDGEIDPDPGWVGAPPAMVVRIAEDEPFACFEGVAERVTDGATLRRFAAQCEARYGYEVELDEPDAPIYAMRSAIPRRPAELANAWVSMLDEPQLSEAA